MVLRRSYFKTTFSTLSLWLLLLHHFNDEWQSQNLEEVSFWSGQFTQPNFTYMSSWQRAHKSRPGHSWKDFGIYCGSPSHRGKRFPFRLFLKIFVRTTNLPVRLWLFKSFERQLTESISYVIPGCLTYFPQSITNTSEEGDVGVIFVCLSPLHSFAVSLKPPVEGRWAGRQVTHYTCARSSFWLINLGNICYRNVLA